MHLAAGELIRSLDAKHSSFPPWLPFDLPLCSCPYKALGRGLTPAGPSLSLAQTVLLALASSVACFKANVKSLPEEHVNVFRAQSCIPGLREELRNREF